MKLKNKRTGEIIDIYKGEITLHYNQGRKTIHFKRLEDLEEWEDVTEEPIQVYIEGIQEVHSGGGRVFIDYATAKEAELAVRKIKAWKRLKDKGFRFYGWTIDDGLRISIRTNTDGDSIYDDEKKEMREDLDICFGGEE